MALMTPRPTASQLTAAPWMEWAYLALGEHRIPGPQHNPIVVDFLRYVGAASNGDETPWCSAFANWCMEQAGIRGTRTALARSWLLWGDFTLARPTFGCVTVLWRTSPASMHGHVGFYVGQDGNRLLLLGGNQTTQSKVTIGTYLRSRVLGYRWPPGRALMLA